jgi:hypothetical protein
MELQLGRKYFRIKPVQVRKYIAYLRNEGMWQMFSTYISSAISSLNIEN